MVKNNKQKLIIVCFIISLITSSCKSIKFQNINDLINKNTINYNTASDKNFNNETYDNKNSQDNKYMINTNTKKVHTFTHGDSIIKNANNKYATNSDIVGLLKNDEYDICRTCYAGLKVIKDFEKNYSVDLIEKFMRLYDFVELEEDRQEFVYCIFEVGEWYVDNVYTYQSGANTFNELQKDARGYASKSAQKRLASYSETYKNKFNLTNDELSTTRILPVVYVDSPSGVSIASSLVLYKCDLFENLNYSKGDKKKLKTYDNVDLGYSFKNHYVIDDCSKFASAVYYHYINKVIFKNESIKDGKGINLWYTGSFSFFNRNSLICSILLDECDFEYYDYAKEITNKKMSPIFYDDGDLKLIPGDLLYRKPNKENENVSHVEFYIGNDKIISWGRIHKSYFLNKIFSVGEEGFYSNDVNDQNGSYITIIRKK